MCGHWPDEQRIRRLSRGVIAEPFKGAHQSVRTLLELVHGCPACAWAAIKLSRRNSPPGEDGPETYVPFSFKQEAERWFELESNPAFEEFLNHGAAHSDYDAERVAAFREARKKTWWALNVAGDEFP